MLCDGRRGRQCSSAPALRSALSASGCGSPRCLRSLTRMMSAEGSVRCGSAAVDERTATTARPPSPHALPPASAPQRRLFEIRPRARRTVARRAITLRSISQRLWVVDCYDLRHPQPTAPGRIEAVVAARRLLVQQCSRRLPRFSSCLGHLSGRVYAEPRRLPAGLPRGNFSFRFQSLSGAYTRLEQPRCRQAAGRQ